MPSGLDYRTLFLGSGIVAGSLLMFLALQTRKPYPGFLRIVVAIDAATAAIIVADLRGFISDAIWVVQVIAISAFALIDSGIRLFCATPRRKYWPLVYVLAAILLQTYLFFTQPLYLRIIVNSLLLVPIFVDAALPLLRDPPTGQGFAYRFTAVAFMLGCVASAVRIFAVQSLHMKDSPYFSASPANTVFFVLLMFVLLAIGFGIIALTHERLMAELTIAHSKRIQLERRLVKSGRLASVRRLAGGFAHFFNNRMQIIQMGCALLRQSLTTGSASPAIIDQIEKASKNGTEIARRLNRFAQSEVLRVSQSNPPQLLKEVLPELSAIAGEKVRIITSLPSNTAPVELDPDLLKETLLILVRNAREAMPEGGKVEILVRDEELDPLCAKQLGVDPGPFVLLSISDTGVGMNDETQRHLFEPFFTTKGLANAEGMGLASAFGYIQQSGGTITVDSKSNQGSTFCLHLPTCSPKPRAA